MSVEQNRAVALSWFKALVEGDAETALGCMHEDFRCYFSGTLSSSGWGDAQAFLANAQNFGSALAGPITTQIGDVTAENDRVWFEAVTSAPLLGGDHYLNTYVLAVRLRDGKVVGLKEFGDTQHVFEVMESSRSPRREWESPLEQVTDTFGGGSVGDTIES